MLREERIARLDRPDRRAALTAWLISRARAATGRMPLSSISIVRGPGILTGAAPAWWSARRTSRLYILIMSGRVRTSRRLARRFAAQIGARQAEIPLRVWYVP
jgi:hypothetical protein